MNIEEITYECIKSEEIKEYLKRIDHKFTSDEIVTLIYNSEKSLLEKEHIFLELLKYKTDKDFCGVSFLLNMIIEVINELSNLENIYKIDLEKEIIFNKFSDLIDYITKNNIKLDTPIEMFSTKTNSKIYYIYLNKDNKVYYFNSTDKDISKIINYFGFCYVDIPNKIKEGDIIKFKNKEWVVIKDSKIPDKLKKECDYTDVVLTGIPKDIFNTKNETLKYHEHIHLTKIE